MSKSALKSVKVMLWAEVHKSQNAKLISISLKNTKHEGNHKLFIFRLKENGCTEFLKGSMKDIK